MWLELFHYSDTVLTFLLVNSIYAAFLALMVLTLKVIFPRLSKQVEYGLWCLVVIRLILPLELSFDYALTGSIRDWGMAQSGERAFVEVRADIWSGIEGLRSLLAHTELSRGIFVAWLVIVAFVLVRYAIIRLKLLQMIDKSQPVVDYPTVNCVNRWRLNLRIRNTVFVIAADKYLSPFTFFYKSPIIFIPQEILASQDPKLITSIIAHEMAHVKRRDALWLLFQNLIQIIYFFNPLVWILVRRLSHLREKICDEMVLSVREISQDDYGSSLINVLRFNLSGDFKSSLSNAFLGYKSQIQARIKAIRDFEKSTDLPLVRNFSLMVYAVFFLPFLTQSPVQPEQTKEMPLTSEQQGLSTWEQQGSPFPEEIRKTVRLPVLDRKDE